MTGTKSRIPASSASTSAAGTCSAASPIHVMTAQSTDVITLPRTYAAITSRAHMAVACTRGRFGAGTNATSH